MVSALRLAFFISWWFLFSSVFSCLLSLTVPTVWVLQTCVLSTFPGFKNHSVLENIFTSLTAFPTSPAHQRHCSIGFLLPLVISDNETVHIFIFAALCTQGFPSPGSLGMSPFIANFKQLDYEACYGYFSKCLVVWFHQVSPICGFMVFIMFRKFLSLFWQYSNVWAM